MYIRTSFVCSTLRVILQGFVDPIMQHRNETVSLGDTVISLHTSSHISHLGWGCILGNLKLKVLSPDQLFIEVGCILGQPKSESPKS